MTTVRIDRLELDLRGVPRATAEDAVHRLGPALQRALAGRTDRLAPTGRVDGGRVDAGDPADPAALARRLARRIADTLTGE